MLQYDVRTETGIADMTSAWTKWTTALEYALKESQLAKLYIKLFTLQV